LSTNPKVGFYDLANYYLSTLLSSALCASCSR